MLRRANCVIQTMALAKRDQVGEGSGFVSGAMVVAAVGFCARAGFRAAC